MTEPSPTLPPIDELDRLDPGAFTAAVAPLFEGAPRFLERLAAARPFGSDEAMLSAAREIARAAPEDEQVELLDAHPRIGADPTSVSELSHTEQGYDEADAPPNADWVDEELVILNEAYEARYGFRFAVFVAGRERAAIIPLIESALHADDRSAELRRGLDDVIDIAADRLRTLRTLPATEA